MGGAPSGNVQSYFRDVTLEDYVEKIYQDMKRAVSMVPAQERQRLIEALIDSHHIYLGQYDRDRTEFADWRTFFDDMEQSHNSFNFMMEFLRQAVQLKRQGEITETFNVKIFVNFLKTLASWVKDALTRLREAMPDAYRGRYGDKLKRALEDADFLLDSKSRGQSELPARLDERKIMSGELSETD